MVDLRDKLPHAAWLGLLLLVTGHLAGCRFELPDPSALVDDDGGAADAGTWRWHGESLPFPNTIHGLWGELDELWAVGNGGLIARHDGKAWRRLTSPTKVDLRAVWGPKQGEAWAVGDGGTILRLQGGAWTVQSSPTTSALYGVWGSGAADVWAVGDGGAALRFDGKGWSATTAGSGDLRAVWGSSAQDVWAVGAGGTLLHRQGSGTWSAALKQLTTRTVFGVWARSSKQVWAVAAGGAVLSYDGSAWSIEDLDTSVNLRAVRGGTSSGVWSVGDRAGQGVIYGLQGATWQAAGTYPGALLHAVWVGPTGQAWAAGGGGTAYRFGP